MLWWAHGSKYLSGVRSRGLDRDMILNHFWSEIWIGGKLSDQTKINMLSFVCLNRQSQECQARKSIHDEHVPRSLKFQCFNVNIKFGEMETLSGMSQNFEDNPSHKLFTCQVFVHNTWMREIWDVFVLVKLVLVCLFMVWDNLLRNLMCLCHNQTMPPRLSLCPVCMSSPKYGFVLLTRNSWSEFQTATV